MKRLLTCFFLLWNLALLAQGPMPVGTVLPTGQVPVHDPVVIKEGNTFYLFCTGFGITVWSSNDLQNWKKEEPVFRNAPPWNVDTILTFKRHIWSTDISFHNGQFYLYYSVFTFGKNTSAIGVATKKTLDPASPDFRWADHGRAIQSCPGKTNWNAIDSNLAQDEKGLGYLVFGSCWDGLKRVKLTKDFLHPAEDINNRATVDSLKKDSSRKKAVTHNHSANAGDNAVEAPFIFKKGPYYYFFASIDYCCRGEKSTYKVVVGRSKKWQGPYMDKDDAALRNDGGFIILQGDKDWYGNGHNGIFSAGGKDYIVYHGYDAADGGRPKLCIRELRWDANGWPGTSTL